jgi:CHAD domain-containing protein
MCTRSTEPIEGLDDAVPPPDALEEGFERRATEFAAAARRVRTGSDPEAIHDLRVATRRLNAALRVWQEFIPPRARRAARRGLRRIRRRIGEARELEVHVALLEDRLSAGSAPGRPMAQNLLERLRERLARRRRSAARRVSPRRLKRVLRRVETAGAGLRSRRPGGPGAPPVALDVERRLAEQAAAALRSASEHPDDVALHEARVRVKKWRYALECLEETFPGTGRPPVRPLRRIQGELGVAHDRALLRELLERHARRADPPDDGVRPLLAGLELERERAVRRFQRLATAFLGRTEDTDRADRDDGAPPSQSPTIEAEPGARAPVVERVAADAARDGATGAAGGRDAPRDERWDRMATWLARSRRRS